MENNIEKAQREANYTRYLPGQTEGHYESFFQRGNHPSLPLGFWVRYTIFSPKGRPEDAIGELWAIFFDGENNTHTAVKKEVPFSQCSFSRSSFDVRVDNSLLRTGEMRGEASSRGHDISWDMGWEKGGEPLFLLPMYLYDTPLPKAKALVGETMITWNGKITVDGTDISVDGWTGSQNHNWGTKHTDHYAWGQVAGFDNSPESFLEIATASLKIGPLWTPPLTPIVFRHEGVDYSMNSLIRSAWKGSFSYFTWQFRGENKLAKLEGRIIGDPNGFVGLRYGNPPSGHKWCLNTKIAACEMTFQRKPSGKQLIFRSANRAAFEILTDADDHGIRIRA